MQIYTEYKAEEFLEKEGFPIVNRRLFTNSKDALNYAHRIKFPVVLKIASDNLLHKSDVNAVRININEENFFREYMNLSSMKIKKEGILVQKFVNGKYIIIGVKKDLTFGHVILVGLGGIFAEVIKDTSLRVLPINRKDAFEMLKELKGYEILKGYRGEKVNLNHVVEVIMKVSKLVEKHPKISELDLNPLVANEINCKIVDARIVFE